MSTKQLKQHIKDFYDTQEPSDACMNHLLLISIEKQQKTDVVKSSNIWIAACFSLLILPLIYLSYSVTHSPGNFMNRIVAQEIALNHNKQLPIEFNAQTIAQLDKQMAQLDFALHDSKHSSLDNLTIIGARYCSIQGNLAAQIRLQDNSGNDYTLFQTPLTQSLNNQSELTSDVNNVFINRWQEDGVFFGLAKFIQH